MYVFDATPLIYLGKAERLSILSRSDIRRVVPDPVYDDVVTEGLTAGHPDARRIERAFEGGVLDTVSAPESELFDRLQENDRLSTADASVLAVADARDGTAIMDEQYGRDIADTEGLDTRGTAYIVLNEVRSGAITPSTALDTIDEIIKAGWYCSLDLYAAIRGKIDDFS